MPKYKERVSYFEKVITGHFMFEPCVRWIAYDAWGNYLASGRTKKECIASARSHGYIVPHDAL